MYVASLLPTFHSEVSCCIWQLPRACLFERTIDFSKLSLNLEDVKLNASFVSELPDESWGSQERSKDSFNEFRI